MNMYVCMFARTLLFDWSSYKGVMLQIVAYYGRLLDWVSSLFKGRNYYSPERRPQLCVCKCVAVNLICLKALTGGFRSGN